MDGGKLLLLLAIGAVVYMVAKAFSNPDKTAPARRPATKPPASSTPARKLKKFSDLKPVRHWADEDETEVVGESRYRKAIAEIAGNAVGQHADKDCTAILFPENDNKHDSDAVAVVIDGHRVGYLSREDASDFRERLKEEGIPGAVTSCPAHIRWGGIGHGGEQIHYSITLRLAPLSD